VERARDEELRALMVRYQQGDEDALRDLYARTSPGIQRYLSRWSDRTRALDLTQETFLQIHRARRTYRPEMPVLPWIYAIARHVALQHVRTTGRRIVEEQVEFPPTAALDVLVLERHDLVAAIRRLPEDQQETVWLADIEGFTSGEIARVTGATEGTVRVRLHRAHAKLRELLGERK
jgi:RNA polymerase sigma-70 factor, ECF subfamily